MAEHGAATVNDTDLPEGVRQVLIAGLELCGAVMRGDADIRERAVCMFAIASEHIVVDEEENV